jgi:phage-related protein
MRLNATLNRVTRDRVINITVNLDDGTAMARLSAMKAMADNLDGRNIKVKGDGSGLTGLTKLLGDATSAGNQASEGMSRYGQRILLMGSAIAVGAAPALGVLSTLLLTIPGAASLAGAGFAAVALGIDGIKAAASTIQPQFEAMKTAISSTFQQGLIPVFQQLAGLFPILTTGLQGIATELVGWAQAFTNVVTSAQGMTQIQNILTNIRSVIDGLTPAITAGTQAFLTLAEVGTANMGVLVDAINRFAEGFNRMVQQAAQTGQLAAAFQQLGNVVDAVLQVFLQLMEVGMQMMIDVGPGLTQFIRLLGDAFVALAPILTTISNTFFAVFNPVLEALIPILQELTPAFQSFGQIIGELLGGTLRAITPMLVQMADVLGNVLLQAFEAIRPVIPIIVQAIEKFFQALTPLLPMLGEFASQLIERLAPYLPRLAEAFMKMVDALILVLPPMMELAKAVLPLLLTILEDVFMSVTVLAEGFAWFVGILAPVTAAIYGVLAALAGFVVDLPQKIGEFFTWLGEKLAELPTWFSEAFTSAKDWIVSIFTSIPEFFSNLWTTCLDSVSSFLTSVGEWFAQLPNTIMNHLGYTAGMITRFFMDLGKECARELEIGFEAVMQFFAELPGKVLEHLTDVGTWLLEAGAAMMRGLYQGILFASEMVFNYFVGLPALFIGYFADAINWLYNNGGDMMRGFFNGLVEEFVMIGEWFANLPTTIHNFFTDVLTWLYETGRDVIRGFWQGLVEEWNMIYEWVAGLIESFIAGFKEGLGVASPSTIFMQIGRDIVMGLILGIQEVWAMLVEFFTMIWQTLVTIATESFNLIIQPILTGLQFIQETWILVWTFISTFFVQIWTQISEFFTTAWTLIYTVFTTGLTIIQTIWQTVWQSIANVFSTVWQTIVNIFNTSWALITGVFQAGLQVLQQVWSNVWNAIRNVFQTVMNTISNIATTVMNTVRNIFQTVTSAISSAWTTGWNAIRNIFQTSMQAISQLATTIMNNIRNIFQNSMSALSALWTTGWNTIRTTFSNVINGIVQIATSVANTIIQIFNSVIAAVTAAINAVASAASSVAGMIGFEMGGVLPKLEAGGTIPVQYLAKGGALGNPFIPHLAAGDSKVGGGFKTNKPQAVVGEGNTAHPEFVIPTDPKYRDRAMGLFAALGAHLGIMPALAAGGAISGDMGGGAPIGEGTIQKIVRGLSPEQLAAVSNIIKYMQNGIAGLMPLIEEGGSKFSWLTDLIETQVSPALSWLGKQMGTAANSTKTANDIILKSTITADQARVASTQQSANKINQAAYGMSTYTAQSASSIGSNSKYVGESANWVAAGVRNLMAAYGQQGGGGGYGGDDSFEANSRQHPYKPGYIQAEDGSWVPPSYYKRDQGGWLPRGLSMVMNQTGQNEKMGVFNPQQWDDLQKAVAYTIDSAPAYDRGSISREDLEAILNKLTSRMGPTIGTLSPQLPKDANLKDVVDEIMFQLRHTSSNNSYK